MKRIPRITRLMIRERVDARYPALAARRNSPALPPPADPKAIALGRNEKREPVAVGERVRCQHLHIIGASGGGKSNEIELIARQTIQDGRGLVLIDPHGHSPASVYRKLLTWLVDTGRLSSRVHVLDPNNQSHVTGLQPFARPSPETDPSVVASNVYEAVEKVFGAGETAGKSVIVSPTIRRILMALFAAAVELDLTFPELPLLLDPYDRVGIRGLVITKLRDRYAKSVLAELHQMALDDRSKRDYRAEVVGPLNRLAEFTRSPAVRAVLGQTDPDRVLDFGKVLAGGEIVLMNAAGGERMSSGDAEVLARLVLRTLFFHIERRAAPMAPFFVVVDECHKVLTGDVERMLAEVRKQSVGFVLAHQTLSQLGKPDDSMRVAVQGNCNLKMVFRLRDVAEAAELAEAVVPLPLEKPVEVLVKPTVVGQRLRRFKTESTGRQQSTSLSKARSRTSSVSLSVGESFSTTHGRSWSRSETDTEGTAETDSKSQSWGSNWQEGESRSAGTSYSENSSRNWGRSSGRGHSTADSSGFSSGKGRSGSISVSAPAGMPGADAATAITRADRGPAGLTSDLPYTLTHSCDTSSSTDSSRAVSSSSNSSESFGGARGSSRGSSEGRTSSRSHGGSYARSLGRTTTRSRSHAIGRTVGGSIATTRGTTETITVGESVGSTVTHGVTEGTSRTEGYTEGLEPIMEMLPTAVHSLEAVRYAAAQMLRGLPTGEAFINYVTKTGMQAAHVFVPEMKTRELPEPEYAELRRKALEASPSATPIEEATKAIAEREQLLIAEAEAHRKPAQPSEPKSFRVTRRRPKKGEGR